MKKQTKVPRMWELSKRIQKEIRRRAKLDWHNSSIEANRNANDKGGPNIALSYGGWVNRHKKQYLLYIESLED